MASHLNHPPTIPGYDAYVLLIAEDRTTLTLDAERVPCPPELVPGIVTAWSERHPAETHRVDAFYIGERYRRDGSRA